MTNGEKMKNYIKDNISNMTYDDLKDLSFLLIENNIMSECLFKCEDCEKKYGKCDDIVFQWPQLCEERFLKFCNEEE